MGRGLKKRDAEVLELMGEREVALHEQAFIEEARGMAEMALSKELELLAL